MPSFIKPQTESRKKHHEILKENERKLDALFNGFRRYGHTISRREKATENYFTVQRTSKPLL